MPVANYWNYSKYRFHTENMFDTPEQFILPNRSNNSFQSTQTVISIPNRQEYYGIQSIWRRLDSESTILPLNILSIEEIL
jgi:hypothetical protein